jgi:hypothetical protein
VPELEPAIQRDALRVPYTKNTHACRAVREAGWRIGWTPGIRAFHVGWDDHLHYPAYLAAKQADPITYTNYREVGLIARPPALNELAQAAPVVAETRAAGVPTRPYSSLRGGEPVVGAARNGVERPGIGSLPLELARAGEGLEPLQGHRRYSTLEDRERWLRFFAAGAFGGGPRCLFVLRREGGSPPPERVRGVERLERWRPPPPEPPRGLRQEIAARLPEPVRRILRRLRR